MSKEEAKRPLPNNIYGLISFVIQTMGDRATPLLVSAGILFAIFMFYREQVASQQAIKEAEEAVIARNQEEARKQQQRIDEAYSRISTLTNDQIESVVGPGIQFADRVVDCQGEVKERAGGVAH